LSAHRLRVIAWDAPGYGASDAVKPAIPEAADYAAALERFVVALRLPKFCLLGHSLGALVAAAYCRLAGTRVERLVLAAPTTGYGHETPEGQFARIKDRLTAIQELGPDGLAEKRGPQLFAGNPPPKALAQARAVMRQLRPDGYIQALQMLSRGDIFADTPRIAAPTLVMCGTGDTVTPEANCRRIADAIAGARFEAIPGPGHALYMEAPEQFDAALLRFIAR
jgi:pimeloyl-ACP methyl ester carboxylesterase